MSVCSRLKTIFFIKYIKQEGGKKSQQEIRPVHRKLFLTAVGRARRDKLASLGGKS